LRLDRFVRDMDWFKPTSSCNKARFAPLLFRIPTLLEIEGLERWFYRIETKVLRQVELRKHTF
jgi:hypothetical protein